MVSTDNNMMRRSDESGASTSETVGRSSLGAVFTNTGPMAEPNILPGIEKPQNQCLCSQTVIDLEDISSTLKYCSR